MRPFAVALALVALAVTLAPASALSGTPAFSNFVMPSGIPNANGAGEPSSGVDPATGAFFFQAYTTTAKVTWNAAGTPTWSDVTAITSISNIDPILVTLASGRTIAGGLSDAGGICSALQYTDDDGATWIPMGNACPIPASDHPSIGGGAWHGAPPLGAQSSQAVYICQQSGTDTCATSKDGGLTFGLPVDVTGGCNSFHGHIKVSADGTAYVPSAYCNGKQGGFRSMDNGASWVSYQIAGTASVSNGGGFDPSIATTPDDTVWEAWADGASFHPMIGRSTTHAASWDRVTDLSATVTPAIRMSTFQAVVAGDNGRVAVAYLGTTDGTGNPFGGNFAGSWDLYVSYSYDAGLTWTTVKATTDPVQRGCVYDVVTSPSCHRNLLDFMDASLGADGRVLVAYADGCTTAVCKGASGTSASSTSAVGTVARQMSGQGLLAAFDG